jgi:L-ascorbate metabolism protein UlaG (beta-lactamase superfamily)
MTVFPVFGKAPDGARLDRIRRSPYYNDGSFHNLVPTEVTLKGVSFLKVMKEFSNRPANTAPPKPLPSVHTDLHALPEDKTTLVWFGHSSYLLKLGKFHLLVDPVFSGNAAPFSFFAKAFPGTNGFGIHDMPDSIDAVLLTHDHYDHLDYKTILRLKPRVRHFYTSLGVGAHLEYWGIPADCITELDWWEGIDIDTSCGPVAAGQPPDPIISLTAVPARHFSGRNFKRCRTIWSAFVLKAPGYSLFLGGDSGYEDHFRTIGDRHGPFDLAILECGQYGKNWPYIHMLPEQTVKAAEDLRATTLMPVHWGKFTLSLHPWDEPIHRVTAAARAAGLSITTPRIGEPVFVNQDYPGDAWYDFL